MMDDNAPHEEGKQADDDRPTTRVPTHIGGNGEVMHWMEFDTEWLEHVQHAEEVHEKIVERYIREPEIKSIGIGKGTDTIAGRATSSIEILVTGEAAKETLTVPDEIDGIEVIIEVG